MFRDHGFGVQRVWEVENRWVEVDGSIRPTAFVAGTAEGVELDVHVIEVEAGVVVPSCDVPWPFDAGSLEGRGVIDGGHVACLSAQTEVAMHRGYELPEAHERDEALLRQLD